jgi:hypothetical protein
LAVTVAATAVTTGVLTGVPAAAGALAGSAGDTTTACAAGGFSRDPVAPSVPATDPSLALEQTRIHWTRWHSRVVYGGLATLAGQVVSEDGAVPGARVDLFARPVGGSWRQVATATADGDTGVFTFDCLRPAQSTDYRVVYAGNLYYAGSEATRRMAVARRVPDDLSRLTSTRFALTGSVQPRYAGRPVLLQRRNCEDCRWRTVARRDSTSRSRWRFVLDASGLPGTRWFRALVPSDHAFVSSPGAHVWYLTPR